MIERDFTLIVRISRTIGRCVAVSSDCVSRFAMVREMCKLLHGRMRETREKTQRGLYTSVVSSKQNHMQ